MDPMWLGFALTIVTTVISFIALWVNVVQGRQQQRQYIETKLDAMQAQIRTLQTQIHAVATDTAKIFGWLEGQRDNRISSKATPDLPQV